MTPIPAYIPIENLGDYYDGGQIINPEGLAAKIDEVGLLVLFGYDDAWSKWTLAMYWGFQSVTNLGYSSA